MKAQFDELVPCDVVVFLALRSLISRALYDDRLTHIPSFSETRSVRMDLHITQLLNALAFLAELLFRI